jgi:hypothetical protein
MPGSEPEDSAPTAGVTVADTTVDIAVTVTARVVAVVAVMAVFRQPANARITMVAVVALPVMPLAVVMARMLAVLVGMLAVMMGKVAIVTVMPSFMAVFFTVGMAITSVITFFVTISTAIMSVFFGLHLHRRQGRHTEPCAQGDS